MDVSLIIDELIYRYPVLSGCKKTIWEAYNIIKDSYSSRGILLICGNGGSAADSEHIVGELMKEFTVKRPLDYETRCFLQNRYEDDGQYLLKNIQASLPAISLTGASAFSTAFANDVEADLVYAQQVNGYGRNGSVLLGISTSGNSDNVIYAIEMAKAKHMKTIGLTGEKGGRLKSVADVCICVPETIAYKVQELHLPVYHCLCQMLETYFFSK